MYECNNRYAVNMYNQLYGMKTLILEEITSTFLFNEIRKRPNQKEQEGLGLVVTGRKGKERKVQVRRRHVTFITRRSLEEWLQALIRVAEEEGASCRDRCSKQCWHQSMNGFFVEDNASQGKGWIFDSNSTVHVYSQKELFNNFLATKEKGIV